MPTLEPKAIALPPVTDASFTINQFCAVEKISRTQLYKDWIAGRGPRFYLVGSHKRISHESRVEWRRRREVEAQANAA
jgi:hypothetical protein